MRWEYKIVMRTREVLRPTIGTRDNFAVGEFIPAGPEMIDTLQALGQDEWELVGISTRASMPNAAVSTEEVWVFKRPAT